MDGMQLDAAPHIEALEAVVAANVVQIIRLEAGLRQLAVEKQELQRQIDEAESDS